MADKMTVKVLIAAAVAAGGTFTVPYAAGFAQADFPATGTTDVSYSGVSTECAVTYGATEITVTWPAGAAASLAPGEYYLDFDALQGGNLPDNVRQASATEDSVAVALADLVADHNALLQNLRDAGLMES